MDRRRLLAALGSSAAATAGCTTTADEPNTASTTRSTTTTDRATTTTDGDDEGEDDESDGHRLGAASVVDLEMLPLTLSLHPLRYRGDDGANVTVEFARTATPDHPATVRGTFENANGFENTFRLRGLPLFSAVPSAWPGARATPSTPTATNSCSRRPTATSSRRNGRRPGAPTTAGGG